MSSAGVLCTLSGQMPLFRPEFAPLSGEKRPRRQKCRVLPCRLGSPTTPPDFWQHYRGFGNLGRSGPGTVRSGQKGNGKIRHFRNEGCVPRGREARSYFETAPTSGKSRCRITDFRKYTWSWARSLPRTANTIGDLRPRAAELP